MARILDAAKQAGSFNTLVQAVEAAGLAETLSGDGPFTVFAPSDDAFARLPEGTIEGLLEDTDKLQAVLTYHVVPGRMLAADVAGQKQIETVQGGELEIEQANGAVKVGGARVIQADVKVDNGVIHVIDAVLLPK